ncbi:MAG: hypothetical protein ACI9OJ_005271 [Myxococcota bacterium]|jgi:hypothetical protein
MVWADLDKVSHTLSGRWRSDLEHPSVSEAVRGLLQRVFLVDILEYPCGGRLRIIAINTRPDVIQAVAAAIILSHQEPARAPPT